MRDFLVYSLYWTYIYSLTPYKSLANSVSIDLHKGQVASKSRSIWNTPLWPLPRELKHQNHLLRPDEVEPKAIRVAEFELGIDVGTLQEVLGVVLVIEFNPVPKSASKLMGPTDSSILDIC